MITYYRSTKLGNIVLKVNKIFRLLVCSHIIKMNVFVAPLKVMNNPLIGKLLLYNEYVLKEVDDPLLDVEMIKFSNHCLLIFKVSFVLVDQSISLINNISYVVKDRTVSAHVQLCQFVSKVLVFLFFSLKLIEHVFYLNVISLKLSHDQFLILTSKNNKHYIQTYLLNLS